MNTTRRDESKKKFYAEVKDILKKKHRESSWYMMELMGVEGKEEADRTISGFQTNNAPVVWDQWYGYAKSSSGIHDQLLFGI